MRRLIVLAVVVLCVLSVSVVNAAIVGTFVEANEANTDNALSPGTAWGTTTDDGTDGLWQTHQGASSSHGSYSVFGSHDIMVTYYDTEAAPEIVTTIGGLVPGQTYAIGLLFGSHTVTKNQIYGGLSADSLTLYNDTNAPVSDAGTLVYEGGVMNRYQASLGNAVADAAGQIKAYVGSAPDADGNPDTYGRVMYDGLSFGSPVTTPEPSVITLLITGLLGLMAYAWKKRK
jgi:hypothetical protein